MLLDNRAFSNAKAPEERLMLLQCDQNVELIACARHNIENEFNQTAAAPGHRRHVVFVIQLPRTAGGCFLGFQVDVTILSAGICFSYIIMSNGHVHK